MNLYKFLSLQESVCALSNQYKDSEGKYIQLFGTRRHFFALVTFPNGDVDWILGDRIRTLDRSVRGESLREKLWQLQPRDWSLVLYKDEVIVMPRLIAAGKREPYWVWDTNAVCNPWEGMTVTQVKQWFLDHGYESKPVQPDGSQAFQHPDAPRHRSYNVDTGIRKDRETQELSLKERPHVDCNYKYEKIKCPIDDDSGLPKQYDTSYDEKPSQSALHTERETTWREEAARRVEQEAKRIADEKDRESTAWMPSHLESTAREYREQEVLWATAGNRISEKETGPVGEKGGVEMFGGYIRELPIRDRYRVLVQVPDGVRLDEMLGRMRQILVELTEGMAVRRMLPNFTMNTNYDRSVVCLNTYHDTWVGKVLQEMDMAMKAFVHSAAFMPDGARQTFLRIWKEVLGVDEQGRCSRDGIELVRLYMQYGAINLLTDAVYGRVIGEYERLAELEEKENENLREGWRDGGYMIHVDQKDIPVYGEWMKVETGIQIMNHGDRKDTGAHFELKGLPSLRYMEDHIGDDGKVGQYLADLKVIGFCVYLMKTLMRDGRVVRIPEGYRPMEVKTDHVAPPLVCQRGSHTPETRHLAGGAGIYRQYVNMIVFPSNERGILDRNTEVKEGSVIVLGEARYMVVDVETEEVDESSQSPGWYFGTRQQYTQLSAGQQTLREAELWQLYELRYGIHGERQPNSLDPMHVAAELGHTEILARFIREGRDVNDRSTYNFNRSALFCAAMGGQMETARYLVDRGADLNAQDTNGLMPLAAAICTRHELVARYLIDKGADIRCQTKSWTALHLAVDHGIVRLIPDIVMRKRELLEERTNDETPLMLAARLNRVGALEALEREGADLFAANAKGMNALALSIQEDAKEAFGVLLEKYPMNYVGKNGLTAVHEAAKSGTIWALELLKSKGWNINQPCQTEQGMAPILYAARNPDPAMLRWFLENGGDMEAVSRLRGSNLTQFLAEAGNIEGYRVLDRYNHEGCQRLLNMPNREGAFAAHFAAAGGHVKWLEFYKEELKGDLDIPDRMTGLRPISWALHRAQIETAQYLYDQCYRPHIFKRVNPFDLLVADHVALLEATENWRVDWTEIDSEANRTLLMWALKHGKEKAAKYLIEHKKADLNVRNQVGRTAVYYAAAYGRLEICRLLEREGQVAKELKAVKEEIKFYRARSDFFRRERPAQESKPEWDALPASVRELMQCHQVLDQIKERYGIRYVARHDCEFFTTISHYEYHGDVRYRHWRRDWYPAVYMGDMDSQNRPSGWGVMIVDQSCRTEGFFVRGKPEYWGREYHGNGKLCYEGELRDGHRCGKGTYYNGHGCLEYKGEFAESNYEGKGQEYNGDGTLFYDGEWQKGRKNGTGTHYYPNGRQPRYSGQWKDDRYEGTGKEYYENGRLAYEGEWKAGMKHGLGRWYHADGRLYFEGRFVEGHREAA